MNNIFTVDGSDIQSAMSSSLKLLTSNGRIPVYHRSLAEKYEAGLAAAKVVDEELEEDESVSVEYPRRLRFANFIRLPGSAGLAERRAASAGRARDGPG